MARRSIGIGLWLSLALMLPAPVSVLAASLDGKTFAGEMVEKGKSKGDKDQFVFRDGKFRSTACDAYGFLEAPYTVSVSGSSTAFSAETQSPKEGTMAWKGTINGNAIEGTAVWTKKGQADITYTFHGTLK